MKISFFSEDDYGKVIPKELEKRGYDIQYDRWLRDNDRPAVSGR